MWSNAHLLFWLSLVPFATAWLGESHGASAPAVLYGVVLLGAACSYFILQKKIIKHCPKNSPLVLAIGNDVKGKTSLVLYVTATVVAFFVPVIAYALFAIVAFMWMVPDKRITLAH